MQSLLEQDKPNLNSVHIVIRDEKNVKINFEMIEYISELTFNLSVMFRVILIFKIDGR